MGEVQFHLRQIHDGSTESIKELSHKVLDDYTRLMDDPHQSSDFIEKLKQDWGIESNKLTLPNAKNTVLGLVTTAQKTLFTTGLLEVKEVPKFTYLI